MAGPTQRVVAGSGWTQIMSARGRASLAEIDAYGTVQIAVAEGKPPRAGVAGHTVNGRWRRTLRGKEIVWARGAGVALIATLLWADPDLAFTIGRDGDAAAALEVAQGADGKATAAEVVATRADASAGPGIGRYASLAAAVADNPNGAVRINYDEQNVPANYAGVLLEYTQRAQARSVTQTGLVASYGMRTLRSQHEEAHPDVRVSTLNIESNVRGSGKNGPLSADYGQTINLAKRGFASGAALPGEMDGLTITVRQDGIYGQPLGSTTSSDACGILINAVNVQDCGFVSAIEAVTENIQNISPFAARYSIQTQIGTMTPNADGGPITYGYVTVANAGANTHAFYAGAAPSASWDNVLYALGRMRITWNGGYDIITPSWADGALKITRDRATNGNSEIRHRGTGVLLLNAQDVAPIYFATSGVPRAAFTSSGNLVPLSGQTINLGAPSQRWAFGYLTSLDVSSGVVSLASLPVHADNAAASGAGLAAGRVYRTATGELRIVI